MVAVCVAMGKSGWPSGSDGDGDGGELGAVCARAGTQNGSVSLYAPTLSERHTFRSYRSRKAAQDL